MTKTYCDKCGIEIDVTKQIRQPYSVDGIPTRKNAGGYNDETIVKMVDLCGDCAYDLGMWLENRTKLDDGRYWTMKDVSVTIKNER